jgi:hypothetical protein
MPTATYTGMATVQMNLNAHNIHPITAVQELHAFISNDGCIQRFVL